MAPCVMILFFLSITTLATFATPEHPSVSDDQIILWKSKVSTPIPTTIAKQLSPMNSLAAKTFQLSPSTVCGLPNVTCFPESKAIRPTALGYRMYVAKHQNQSSVILGPDRDTFFRMSELQAGKKMKMPPKDKYPPTVLLPEDIAAQLQFNEERLTQLFPHYYEDDVLKNNMDASLFFCTAPDQDKYKCSSSLEQILKFAESAIISHPLAALAPSTALPSELHIHSVQPLSATETVSCHLLFFPVSTYYCHSPANTRLFLINRSVFAVCHLDTSKWPRDHAAFRILKTSPGEGEACHWFSGKDLTFISFSAAAKNGLY